MSKPKLKRGWFFDIMSNFSVTYREYEPGQSNNGDYYHHDWVGPFKTFENAKKAGLKELKLRLVRAKREYEEFAALTLRERK